MFYQKPTMYKKVNKDELNLTLKLLASQQSCYNFLTMY